MKLKKLLSEVTGVPLMKVISNPYAKAFAQVNEEEQETYTATNKETGNVAVFKSKASRDAAVKSGSHEMRKSDKQGPVKTTTPNIFSKDTGYDAGGEEPKRNIFKRDSDRDSKERLKKKKAKEKSAGLSSNEKEDLENRANDIGSSDDIRTIIDDYKDKLSPEQVDALKKAYDKMEEADHLKYDDESAGNELFDEAYYEVQDIISKLDEPKSTSSEPDYDKYNFKADTITDFFKGDLSIDDLQKVAKKNFDSEIATEKDLDGFLNNKFMQDTMADEHGIDKDTLISKVKELKAALFGKPSRKGNPQVNKAVNDKAKKLGITPQKLGEDEYKKKMSQAAVAALTDANFHSEARELISKLEGKPEWAEDPRKSAPSFDSPEYDDWAKSSVYSSEYYDAEGEVEDLGLSAAQEAGWVGSDALDGIAVTLRQNGFGDLADTIQSVIKENKSTKLKDLIKK